MRTGSSANMFSLLVSVITAILAVHSYSAAESEPRLAVIVVVDQMRPDHVTRFDHLYSGGIRRMLDGGFTFLNGFHNHALTETGAGHAVISTGSYPARNGITGNSWYDARQRRNFYCVEDSTTPITGKPHKEGCSPVTMKCMTLGDWVWRDSPESRIFSLAIKDRAAVTMAGFRADYALWFDKDDGTFVTSLYYDAIYPDWLNQMNETNAAEQYFTGVWKKLLPDSAYEISRQDDFAAEADGEATSFPHSFLPGEEEDPSDYYDNLRATPFADHMVLQLAEACITHEELGVDTHPDILWVGCSAADYIGHTYGPFSQEVQDYYLRLDRYLGELMTHLDTLRGEGSYIITLTSDHGVLPLPEHLREHGIDSGRLDPDSVRVDLDRIGERVAQEFGLSASPIHALNRGVFLDEEVISEARADRRRLEISLAEELRKLPYIEDVFTSRDLTQNVASRPYLQQYRNNYYEGRAPDIMLRIREHWLVRGWSRGTTHGSCYSYDTDVPIILYGPGIPHGVSNQQVETVSIAPTVGELIGHPHYHEIDGESLTPHFRKK